MYLDLLPDDGRLLQHLRDGLRDATLFDGLDEAALTRTGVANGNRASVRALGWHIAGHELHHLNLIRDRYLAG
jgi:hypothetical protein